MTRVSGGILRASLTGARIPSANSAGLICAVWTSMVYIPILRHVKQRMRWIWPGTFMMGRDPEKESGGLYMRPCMSYPYPWFLACRDGMHARVVVCDQWG